MHVGTVTEDVARVRMHGATCLSPIAVCLSVGSAERGGSGGAA